MFVSRTPPQIVISSSTPSAIGVAAAGSSGKAADAGHVHNIAALTTSQRNALSAVAGYTIFNTDTSKLQYYNGSSWVDASGGGGGGASYTYRELAARYVTTPTNTGIEVAGEGTWNPTEHDVTGGRHMYFRAVIQCTDAFEVRVHLYNLTLGAYVQNLDGVGHTYLSHTGTGLVLLTSDEFVGGGHTNFRIANADSYEVHVQCMNAAAQAVLGWAQFAVTP